MTNTPSFSGIESRYNKPLDEKYSVPDLATAVSKNVDYNVPNMVIFVKDEKAFYVLKDNVSGNQTNHWKKITSETSIFSPYDSTRPYTIGETCSIGSNMFITILNANVGQAPTTNPENWLQVSSITKLKVEYVEETEFVLNHSIPNAVANVYDTQTGSEIGVLVTRTAPNQFKIESKQPTSGTVIVS